MPVVMNTIPTLLDTMDYETAKAQAAEWVENNGVWLKQTIDKHKEWLTESEVEKYQDAYDGYLESIDIRDKSRDDDVNHKIQVNYAQLIIDTVVDYMLGKSPIWTFEADQDDADEKPSDELLQEYRRDMVKLLRDEGTQRMLSEQLRQGSIAGYSIALAWVNEDSEIAYDEFPVQEMYPVFDNKGRLRLVIRYYESEGDGDAEGGDVAKTKVEIYDGRYITYAVTDNTGASFELDADEVETGNPIEHKSARVPVGIFINGTPARHSKRKLKAGSSDLGNGVYSLLESYAATLSDKANTVDRILDQFLLLTNVDTDKGEVQKMRQSRAIVLKSKESSATFLAPSQDDNAVQNYMTDLRDAIHDMTSTPRMNDLSGATATEIKMKYAALDIKAGKKDVYFMSNLKQLIAVLTDMLNWKRLSEAKVSDPYAVLKGNESSSVPLYKSHWLQPTLTRNLPQNYQEIATIVATLADKVPDTYLYELLWFVDDPKQALDDMKKQKKANQQNATNSLFGGGEFVTTGGKDQGKDTDPENKKDNGGDNDA